MTFAVVEIGGIGDHVAGSIENVIIGVGGNIIEELIDGQRGCFSVGCVFGADRADGDQEIVIHRSSIKENGINDALDAFNTGVVKRRT